MKTNTATESKEATQSNVVEFPNLQRRPAQPPPPRKLRFRIEPFQNRGGTTSWRVTGTKRDGTRIRENFANEMQAQCRQVDLQAEFFARAGDSALRATQLSDNQIKICEAALRFVERDEDILVAVEFWRKHGRPAALVESPRLDDAVKAFLADLENSGKRPQTQESLRRRVGMFANSVGNKRVCDITAGDVEKYLEARGISLVSQDNDRRAICAFLKFCQTRPRNWITHNPARDVQIRKPEAKEVAVLTVPQAEKLLHAAQAFKDGRLLPYVVLGLYAGIRPDELRRMRPEQINFVDGEIRIEAAQSKTKRGRTISLGESSSEFGAAIRRWFANCKGKPIAPANINNDLEVLRKIAGFGDPAKTPGAIVWAPDILRHTAISHFFRLTHSYGQTAEQFGNSESIIKRHYQGRVSSEETEKFYGIMPAKGGSL